jgi:DNA-binding PadR family transcriptional regulator
VGVLELAVLGLLHDSDLHGYELKKRLADLLGPWSTVSFGSLYPALGRLERHGLVSVTTSAEPGEKPAEASPMSGSLGAELAAFRARGRTRAAGGRRARKVYALTDAGRAELRVLIDDTSGDDRTFAVRVALAGYLDDDERLALFRRRKAAVVGRLDQRSADDDAVDPYRRRSRTFQDDRLRSELAWLDELIASELQSQPPAGDDPALSTSGGSPS